MITVKWPKWVRIINTKFVELTQCFDRFVILYGSRGSGKSDYVAKQLVFNCLSHNYFKCILYRKKYNTIQESSYENIRQTIISLGLQELFTFRVSPLQIICYNGNRFIARGGDDANSLKSIKDPTCVWYEEDVPDEDDFATITLTIRSSKADRLQEYFTINPEVEGEYAENWFWKRFFANSTELSFKTKTVVEVEGRKVEFDTTVHHSTYQDNRWLPDAVKAQIENYKDTNQYLYSVYAKGLWTMKQTGGNFYKLFQRSKNTGETIYDKSKALHISFDFNVNPYMTLTIWQLDELNAYQIDEICLETPKNRTSDICKEFAIRYRSHDAGLFVYGDPSGVQEDTRTEKGQNDYSIIMAELKSFKPIKRVASSAPPVSMRGNWINAIFNHNEGGLNIVIGNKCTKSIADLMYLKEASDGTKAKLKERNKETGVSYEKYGHCFVGETMITVLGGEKRIDCIEVGDMVLTRKGFRKVLQVHDNGVKEVVKYSFGITCTPEHLIWTKENNFIVANAIHKHTICIFDKQNNKICLKKLSNTTDGDLQDTPNHSGVRIGCIIQDGLISMEKKRKFAYIITNGFASVGKFQRVFTFITLMETKAITALKTLTAYLLQHTHRNMKKNLQPKGKLKGLDIYLTSQYQNQKSGIAQKRAWSGIGKMLKTALLKLIVNVRSAKKTLPSQFPEGWLLNSVQGGVRTGTMQEFTGNKRRVYDITVEGEHEYFANGVLVHNCSDSMDYIICYAFSTEFNKYKSGGNVPKAYTGPPSKNKGQW